MHYIKAITNKDRNFMSAVVRSLCKKACTFAVSAENTDKDLLINPFMLYQETPKARYQEYNLWVSKNRIPTDAEITIYLYADISGQAHKVLELACSTATIMNAMACSTAIKMNLK